MLSEWCGVRIAFTSMCVRCAVVVNSSVRMEREEKRMMFRKLINRIRKRRFCKANRWFCPDCIYHEHLFDGIVCHGVRCHYPMKG